MFRRFDRTLSILFVCAAACVIVVPAATAQSTLASLTGTIADQSGGVLPGVSVTLTNAATGFERSVTTDELGAFQLPNLDAGSYRLVARLEGFVETTRAVELLARQVV